MIVRSPVAVVTAPLFTKFLFTVISLCNVKAVPVSTSIFAKVQRVAPVLKLALPVNFKVPVPFPVLPAPLKVPPPKKNSFSNFKVAFSNSTRPFCIFTVFATASEVIETLFEAGIVTSSSILGMPVGLQFAAVFQSPPSGPVHV